MGIINRGGSWNQPWAHHVIDRKGEKVPLGLKRTNGGATNQRTMVSGAVLVPKY